jgi:hypothetical protein
MQTWILGLAVGMLLSGCRPCPCDLMAVSSRFQLILTSSWVPSSIQFILIYGFLPKRLKICEAIEFNPTLMLIDVIARSPHFLIHSSSTKARKPIRFA